MTVDRTQRLRQPSLRDAWEEHAEAFIAWAREPGHDSYWRVHRDAFLPLVPAPGRRTLDLGSGEGRLSRDLKALGPRTSTPSGTRRRSSAMGST